MPCAAGFFFVPCSLVVALTGSGLPSTHYTGSRSTANAPFILERFTVQVSDCLCGRQQLAERSASGVSIGIISRARVWFSLMVWLCWHGARFPSAAGVRSPKHWGQVSQTGIAPLVNRIRMHCPGLGFPEHPHPQPLNTCSGSDLPNAHQTGRR